MDSVGCLISSQYCNQLYLSSNHLNLDVLFSLCCIQDSHKKQALLQDV